MTLECTATNRVSSTPELIWAHNGRVLPAPFSTSTAADDLDLRQKYQIETESKPGSKKGRLTVFDLHSEDAGTYACLNQEASNSERPATVRILVGEFLSVDIVVVRHVNPFRICGLYCKGHSRHFFRYEKPSPAAPFSRPSSTHSLCKNRKKSFRKFSSTYLVCFCKLIERKKT